MNKEINYPIKYAVLELIERGGWSVGYKDITQGFIVSKCYVVESNIVYHSDGSYNVIHKVVFPYSDITTFKNSLSYGGQNIGRPEIPRYDACDKVYPVNMVTVLFDSYEQAKVMAAYKNKEYRDNLVFNTPAFFSNNFLNSNWKEQLHELEQKFLQNLEICNLFEQLVLEKTKDMDTSEEVFDDKNAVKVLRPVKREIKDY